MVPPSSNQNENAAAENPTTIAHKNMIENKIKEIEGNLEAVINNEKTYHVKTFA